MSSRLHFQNRLISCGPVTLQLAGVPPDSKDNLILSLIHQLHFQTNDFRYPPAVLIPMLITQFNNFIATSYDYNSTVGGDLQSLCDCFTIEILVYFDNDRVTYSPSTNASPFFKARLYHSKGKFDSIVSILPSNLRLTTNPAPREVKLRMASWNIRGATDVLKRDMIDHELCRQQIWIAAIQESHLRSHLLNTTNYNWELGSQTQTRASRGVGFLIHRDFRAHVISIEFLSVNIGVLKFQMPSMDKAFFMVNIHKCTEGDISSGIETGLLSAVIQKCIAVGHVIVAGDFNSHFGFLDENIRQSDLFGNILLHAESNRNGDEIFMLCELLNLTVLTTMRHHSTKLTWSNQNLMSQIDHVLLPKTSSVKVHKLRASWTKVATDHKIISWTVLIPLVGNQIHKPKIPSYSLYYSKAWDLSMLSNENIRDNFDRQFGEILKEVPPLEVTWDKLSSIACFCANKIIKKKGQAMTNEHRLAYLSYRSELEKIMRPRIVDMNPSLVDHNLDFPPIINSGNIKLLRDSHRALQQAKNNKSRQSLDNFLQHLQDHVVQAGQKVQMAFDYLKVTKRSVLQKCSTAVSIKNWDDEQKALQGPPITLLAESDNHPLLPPPSYLEMMAVLKTMRNNKTPGVDNVCVELIKSSENLCYQLYKLIRHAYLVNELPIEWQRTYSVPIAKVSNPKSVNDYRKLTMCTNAYKIYSVLLMDKIKNYLPPMPYYQSGFIKSRSCDDLCFVMRNILDYRWSRGKKTYVISLDLKKAFDSVKISELPKILISYHVPKYLINRVISAVLTEYNSIYWQGQFTQEILKGVGIKQGCRVSPELFVYILHESVMATKRILHHNGIEMCIGDAGETLDLPLFLAYADDSYLLCENIQLGMTILEVFIEQLGKYGLTLNCEKSSVLIKDPMDDAHPTSIPLQGNSIPVVQYLKVLGTPINSNMNRKSCIKPRVTTALRMFRALLPYLKNLKAPMELLVRLYTTILVPSMIYGLSCSSMTKANASTLMRREVYILKELSNIAHPRPTPITISELLNKKTINRKVTVGRIRFYYHVKRSRAGSLILQSLSYTENSRRKIGRPIYDFSKTLAQDFRKYLDLGMTKSDMDEDFELRDAIKQLTSELYKKADLIDDPLPSDLNLYSEQEMTEF